MRSTSRSSATRRASSAIASCAATLGQGGLLLEHFQMLAAAKPWARATRPLTSGWSISPSRPTISKLGLRVSRRWVHGFRKGRSWRPTACDLPFSARQMRSASSSSNCPKLRADKVARPDRAVNAAAAWRPFLQVTWVSKTAAAFRKFSLAHVAKLTRETGDCWGLIRLRAAR